MSRVLVPVLVTACLGGAVLGWMALPPPAEDDPATPSGACEAAEVVHRFPLTAADMHLDRQVPAVAVDAAGRVVLAWASATGETERALYVARSADGGRTFEQP